MEGEEDFSPEAKPENAKIEKRVEEMVAEYKRTNTLPPMHSMIEEMRLAATKEFDAEAKLEEQVETALAKHQDGLHDQIPEKRKGELRDLLKSWIEKHGETSKDHEQEMLTFWRQSMQEDDDEKSMRDAENRS